MESDILKVVGQIAGIGGIALGVLLILFREIIKKNVFPTFTKKQGFTIFTLILLLVWSIAIFGIGAWVYNEKTTTSPNKQTDSLSISTVNKTVIVNGLIADMNGKGIKNVKVFLKELNKTDYTDDNGKYSFSISGNDKMIYDLLIEHSLYESIIYKIQIDFSFNQLEYNLDEVRLKKLIVKENNSETKKNENIKVVYDKSTHIDHPTAPVTITNNYYDDKDTTKK